MCRRHATASLETYISWAVSARYDYLADRAKTFSHGLLEFCIGSTKTWRADTPWWEDGKMFRIATYADSHFDGVDALWREAFPNDPPRNTAGVAIPEKLRVQPDLLLVALMQDDVIGSVMAGYDGHRGWISRIAVRKSNRLKGVGRSLLAEAEARLSVLGCTKINLQVAASNALVTDFYKHLGYKVEERVSMSKLVR